MLVLKTKLLVINDKSKSERFLVDIILIQLFKT